jgi:tetrahydromethanopterin S-methyltransferase subunit F
MASNIVTLSLTSCIRSLSDETTVTSAPASFVGLIAAHVDRRHVERLDRAVDDLELRDQLLGRGRTVGLVLGINLVAEGLARGVEDHRDMVRVGVVEDLHQHLREAVHRVDRRPVGTGQRPDGIKSPENKPGPVDQIDMLRRLGVGHGQSPECKAVNRPQHAGTPGPSQEPARDPRARAFKRRRSMRGAGFQHESAAAIGTVDLAFLAHVEKYARMAERPVTAVAGDLGCLDVLRFRRFHGLTASPIAGQIRQIRRFRR